MRTKLTKSPVKLPPNHSRCFRVYQDIYCDTEVEAKDLASIGQDAYNDWDVEELPYE